VCSVIGDDIPEARDINRYVVPYCAAEWRELGEALGLTPYKLDIINVDHPNSCEDRCKVMLREWVKLDHSATWGKLVDATDSVSSQLCTDTKEPTNQMQMINFGSILQSGTAGYRPHEVMLCLWCCGCLICSTTAGVLAH